MLAEHPAPEIAIDRIQAWGDQDCPPHGIVTAGIGRCIGPGETSD